MSFLSASRMRGLLRVIGERLAESGDYAELYVIGGGAIALTLDDDRLTYDLDAVIKGRSGGRQVESARAVRDAAGQISDEFGLPFDWLNDMADFAGFVPAARDDEAQVLIETETLKVVAAGPTHLLAMKVIAAREKDVDDLRLLAQHLGVNSAPAALAAAQSVLGDDVEIPEKSVEWVTRLLPATEPPTPGGFGPSSPTTSGPELG